MNIDLLLDSPTLTLLYILIIILATSILTKFIAFIMNRMHRFENKAAIYLIRDIINYFIYFVSLMIILQLFGINLAGTLLSLGIAGIALSFAAKDIISNLFSGIILIIGRSIRVGDTIEIKNKKGVVERVTLRSTIITDDNGVKEIIPNSTLTNFPYLLFKKPEKYRVDINTGLSLDNDVVEFKEYIINIISSYDEILKDPKPAVYSKGITFEESQLKVSFWVKELNNKEKAEGYCSTFSGQNIKLGDEKFTGTDLTAIFSGIKFDMINAKLEKESVLNASAIFGGIEIYVPEKVNVKIKSSSIFGGVSDKRKNTSQDDKNKTIYVNATCIFGGVEIK